jgi:asparagine synthase (glutamine-hydrolysing)
MCGIAGIVRWGGEEPVEPEIKKMVEAMAHRGPDGEGFLVRDSVALGHRRLAIIDLETGRQPLCNEDETIWITYNGEVYNYRELRCELEEKGHTFATKSDTEVIVHAYEEWDGRCVEKFRGMFAFAIADFNKRRLFLARDHLGIKPLYFVHMPRYFAFASEIKALRSLPGLQPTVDVQAIDQYLRLQYIPAPKTAFKEIVKVPPAHRLSMGFEGNLDPAKRYWQVEFRPDYGRKRMSGWKLLTVCYMIRFVLMLFQTSRLGLFCPVG